MNALCQSAVTSLVAPPSLNPRHFGDHGGGKTSEWGTYLSFSVPKMEARYSAISPNLPGPADRRIPWHPPNTSQVRDGNICRPTTREMIERLRPIGTEGGAPGKCFTHALGATVAEYSARGFPLFWLRLAQPERKVSAPAPEDLFQGRPFRFIPSLSYC